VLFRSRDIELSVEPGEFISITGPSGSGKSSLLYLLGLLDRPSEGRIRLDGIDTSALDGEELARQRLTKLGFVFQFHFLLPEFTALDNVMIPMLKRGGASETKMRERAAALLDALDLATQARKRPDQLSGGQRQRVAIARALANDPLVVLADEPTGNLDSRNAGNVAEIFERLVGEFHRTVIMVTHDPELARRAHRQIRLVDGRVTQDGSAEG
jgi:lipoprotein-releasing system ATP-binding protein